MKNKMTKQKSSIRLKITFFVIRGKEEENSLFIFKKSPSKPNIPENFIFIISFFSFQGEHPDCHRKSYEILASIFSFHFNSLIFPPEITSFFQSQNNSFFFISQYVPKPFTIPLNQTKLLHKQRESLKIQVMTLKKSPYYSPK